MIQSFIYNSEIYEDDKQNLTDQNVYSYKFINIGTVPVFLNNNIYLPGIAFPDTNTFDENMQDNQKTKTQYSIRFDTDSDFDIKKLLVISKIPAK